MMHTLAVDIPNFLPKDLGPLHFSWTRPAGRLLWSTLIWVITVAIVLWLGLRHPPVWDETEPLDRKRKWLAVVAAAIFLLCFMPVPLTQIAIAAP